MRRILDNKDIHILVVDDSPDTLEVIQRNLKSHGFVVFTASSVVDAVQLLESTPIAIVITDMKMPGIGGFELIRHVRENYEDTEIMMITGYPTIEGAVKAVKTGADEFLAKPFTDEELVSSVGRVQKKMVLKKASRKTQQGASSSFTGLIGESEVMKKTQVFLKMPSKYSEIITGPAM